MKTVICHKPYEMELMDTEFTSNINENEVLINIKKIGICGTDIHAYGGNQPFFDYPRILGHELSGIAEEIGEQVKSISEGDKVTVLPYINCNECLPCKKGQTNCCKNMQVLGVHRDGGMREYIKVPAENVFAVNNISLEKAATIEPLSIGAHAVKRSEVSENDTVLVVGTGPIGLGVARFAKLTGAKTIVMDLSEERLSFSKEWAECEHTIQAGDRAKEKLLELNDGELPSVVLDATGNKNSMMNSFDYVSHGGKLVYVGLVKDTISFFDPDFHSKELTLLGSRNATKQDFQYVIDCMSNGEIKDNYITNNINFDAVPSFFKAGDFKANKTLIHL